MSAMRKRIKGILLYLYLCMALVFAGCGKQEDEGGEWYEKYTTICHALGRTKQGDVLTNSREAFLFNYEKGYRVFEVDLSVTADDVVVLRHDWEIDLGQAEGFGWAKEQQVPLAETFLETPIYGQYTPLTLLDLYEIMKKYKDVYIVLDSKYSSEMTQYYSLIVNTALENGCEEVLKRVIPQLYYTDMYEEVNTVYPFDHYIFTLYYIGYAGGEETAGFCRDKNIPVLAMPYTWISEEIMSELEPYPAKVWVHTVNEGTEARRMRNLGVSGIYTEDVMEFQSMD